MPAPHDPNEVEPTLLPVAPKKPASAPSKSDAPVHAAPHDGTIVHRVTGGDDGATLVSGARPAPKKPVPDDVDVTRMPDVTAVSPVSNHKTVVEPDPDAVDIGATIPTPSTSRPFGAGSGVLSAGLSHDTQPASGSGSGVLGSGSSGGSGRLGGGTVIGRFALRGLHASGGLGEVFTARDTELNREVAVKRIKSRYADDPGSRRRFLTEAELTARLDHPGVVPVFGLVNDARGRPVYAMRFIRGETLKDELERYHNNQGSGDKRQESGKTEQTGTKAPAPAAPAAPAPVEKAVPRTVAFRHLLSRFVYVCQAIAYAHEKGIIHRDIKPANVMVGKFGEVLVVDWGLAKSLSDGPDYDRVRKKASEVGFRRDPEATDLPSHMTMDGVAVGTPSYMPPEQAAGQLDKVGPKADVYSLGATLFAILTGKAPFTGKSAADTLDAVRKGAFEPPTKVSADCPKPLEAICLKAMALNPDNRYETAQALAADVERWLSDEPVSAYPDPFLARAARWSRRHPSRVAATVSLLFAGILAAGGIAWAIHLGERNTRKERDRVVEQEKKTAEALVALEKEQQETRKERDRAIDQEKKTEAEKIRVDNARKIARQRYEKAVEAYGFLVNDVDANLADRAGMQAIRKSLLLNATEGLKKLVDEKVEGDIGADRTLVAANRQMGDVYQIIGETTKAKERFVEAVRIARLVKQDAQSAEMRAADRDLARSLDRLAGVHVLVGDTKAALDAINEAITLFVALAADKTDAVAQQDLAAARARLAKILMARGNTQGAADEGKLALAARQELSDQMPLDLGRKRALATSLDALANVQLRTSETTGAADSAAKALKLRNELAAEFPPDRSDVRRELADARARLGEVLYDRALMTDAAKEYEAGVKVLDDVAARDPLNAGARADRALLRGRLAQVQIRTGDIELALANAKLGKEECEKLEGTDRESAKAKNDLALARQRYGEALLANGFAKEGLAEYETGRDSFEALQKLDTESAAAKLELARGWEFIGDAKLALKDTAGAVEAYTKSVDFRTEAEKKDTGSASAKRDLAVGLYKLADAYAMSGKPVLANELASRATKLLTGLADANPDSGQAKRDIAVAYSKWGQVLANDGRSTGAVIVWQSSLGNFQEIADKDAGNVQAKEEEAAAWERLAEFHASLGSNDQALTSARRAVEVWTLLGQRADARTKAGQKRLALAMIRCGDINAEVRQLPKAGGWYKDALKQVEGMKADPLLGPVNDLAHEKLAFLEAVKAGLANPRNLRDKQYAPLQVAALRTVATLEVRAEHFVNAALAADELALVATTPADMFAAAKTFAACTATDRGTDFAKNDYAKSAVIVLKSAVDKGFRDAAALNSPEWAAVRKRAAELDAVQAELAKLRTANN